MTVFRYAVPIRAWLPGDLPAPDNYPACSQHAEGWYAVIAVPDDDLADVVVEDVRRSEWAVPDGVSDWRTEEQAE